MGKDTARSRRRGTNTEIPYDKLETTYRLAENLQLTRGTRNTFSTGQGLHKLIDNNQDLSQHYDKLILRDIDKLVDDILTSGTPSVSLHDDYFSMDYKSNLYKIEILCPGVALSEISSSIEFIETDDLECPVIKLKKPSSKWTTWNEKSITIPDDGDFDTMLVTLENGILTIVMSKYIEEYDNEI
jgi:hypothetical protein